MEDGNFHGGNMGLWKGGDGIVMSADAFNLRVRRV